MQDDNNWAPFGCALPVLQECQKASLNVRSLSRLGLAFVAFCFKSDCDFVRFHSDEVGFLFVLAASFFFRHLFESSHIIAHCPDLLAFHVFGD